MAKVEFDPIIKWITGKIGKLVHRRRLGEASRYAGAAVADPDLRPIYIQMAIENGKNPKRPYDMAVSDYCNTGNDLLWKKYMGDQPKPQNWKMKRYSWYRKKPK
jgi:hypothetical protein